MRKGDGFFRRPFRVNWSEYSDYCVAVAEAAGADLLLA